MDNTSEKNKTEVEGGAEASPLLVENSYATVSSDSEMIELYNEIWSAVEEYGILLYTHLSNKRKSKPKIDETTIYMIKQLKKFQEIDKERLKNNEPAIHMSTTNAIKLSICDKLIQALEST